ncbi:MAG: RDD family protein [Conexivisphaerales archaeon]
MYCPNCGKQIPDDAKFCPNCGKQIIVTAAPPSSGSTVQSQTTAPPPQTSSQPVTPLDRLTTDTEAQTHWILRVIAYVIDLIIVSIVVLIAYGVIAYPLLITGLANPFGIVFGIGTLGVFYAGLLMMLYAAFAEAMYGATLGKRILRLKVISATSSVQKLGLRETLIRNVAKLYWILLLLDLLAGLLTQGDYRQRYTDRVAGTLVIKE